MPDPKPTTLTMRVELHHDDPEVERAMAQRLVALADVLGLQVTLEEGAARPDDSPATHRDAR